jgi:amidase
VPFALKDLDAFSEGDPFHGGMNLLKRAGYLARHSSFVVDKYLAAGFVVVGKTNTPELGLNVTTEPAAYGPTRNPWNTAHSTGGSSGGSGAAVAAGMVPAAHAGDGGGSIRIPSSECGLVGLKPSRGRISLGPEFGEYWAGLVTPHVVTRSVRDSAAILDATAGAMPGDPYTAPLPVRPFLTEVGADPGHIRIGLLTKAPAGAAACHPECTAAVESTGRTLESLGHHVEVAHPAALDEHQTMLAGFSTVVGCFTAKALAYWSEVVGKPIEGDDVEPGTRMLAEMGGSATAAIYLKTVESLHAWSRRMASWWAGGFDLLVTPTIAAPPPRIGELTAGPDNPHAMERTMALMCFTPQYNITGQPALSLPLAWSKDGLPIGVQLVAAYGREDLLFRVAAQLEQAAPWKDRRPALS